MAAAPRSGAALAALLQLLPDIALVLDDAGRIVECNAPAAAACGLTDAALAGGTLVERFAAEDADEARRRLDLAAAGATQSWRATIVAPDGRRTSCELHLGAVRAGGVTTGFVVVATDLTRLDALEAQLAERAMQDPLTGLANRMRFRERVERALQRYRQHRVAPDADEPPAGHHLAVLFVDLDDFKTVNDSLGHAEGDRLLEEVGARLLKATRGFDLVARLGGDEFGVLLDGMMRDTDAHAVVERITRALQRPVMLGDREVVIGASIGVAYGRDAATVDELLRNADVAMYQAKAGGKGRFAEFDHAMHAAAVARLELAADLRHALERAELELVYQPVVELDSAAIVAVEALLRWRRAGVLLAPAAFVPLAEETGLIVPIGQWVLQEACRQLAEWRATLPHAATLAMNVNVSGRQLAEPGFVDEVLATLAATGVPAASITLEITETVLVARAGDGLEVLRALRRHGLRVAIDDFGTGYSSLGYLQHFPVDVLKIDRAFVERVTQGGSEAALTRTIVDLGEALGLDAVAEGIETGEQQEALAALGCRRGQGYLFARPLAAAALQAHLAARVPGGGA